MLQQSRPNLHLLIPYSIFFSYYDFNSTGLMQQQRQAWLAHIRMRCQRRYGIVLTDEEIESFDYDSDETVEFDSGLPISIHAIMQERLRIAETRRRSHQMAILRTFR